ncbi:glycosyltransferase family 4 protein [Thomasclavelia spiroformis]|jgi:LPS biosynthesis glycosyltransferase-like protein|uniref:glycosyltransferase family 4 protein n=1 Tax=Thomasclavelia spiroformis TaxID=29348 RepID=UPI000B39378F|nr:glycosyltransferase family 4 protein [Thomasclavelia spiroformis]OUQ03139.1 glycosyltransferase WbuB [Thomasclavelia spiroformis]
MKILIISQYFYPENFRINDLALELKNRGHKITVLTGLPNYPKGEYFDGYDDKKNCDEIWNDILIYRCKLRPRKTGSVNLIKNYLSFVIEANKKLKELENQDFDLIYVFEVSPITVALPAIKFKKKKKIPIVINIQDLWPENIIAVTGITNFIVIGLVNKMVNYIYKHCDLILTASPSFVDKIRDRIKNKDKVAYWPQYSIVSKTNEDVSLYNKDFFNIVFTGNIGEAQGIDLAIEAANILKNEKICWHFVGEGRNRKKLEKMVKEYNIDERVIFHGFHPEKEIPKYLKDADAALLILKPNPIFEMTIPAKLQTYLACGVPILGCVSGEGKRIIEESNAGIVSDEISVEALVKACQKFINLNSNDLNAYKDKAFQYGDDNFNKNNLILDLEKYMENMRGNNDG